MLRNCDNCANEYEARSSRSRFCSDSCRVNNSRKSAPPDDDDEGGNSLVGAIRAELVAAGKLNTSLGQLALVLARRIGSETTGVAALSKELSRVTAAAVGSAASGADAAEGDYIDELRKRRDAKKAV